MPDQFSNFTTPDDPNHAPSTGPGQGAPTNAYWDPVTKSWKGTSTGPVPGPGTGARPAGTTWDPKQQGWVPAYGGASSSEAGARGDISTGPPKTEGRVAGVGAWGGYASTVTRNPDGTLNNDRSMSGAAADTERYQGMGAAAASRPAYQTDYSAANGDAANAAGARVDQGNAIGLARNTALYGSAQTQQLGRRMIRNGLDTQQAAAMSTRGGGLAQAAAMAQQRNGAAAYAQQGQNAINAQQADDMAMGRNLYMQQATDQRAGDATAQSLHGQQATGQMKNEIGQRQLNDQRQQGFEGLGYDVQAAQMDAGLKNEEIDQGVTSTADQNNQNNKDRDLRIVGTGASMVGTVLGAAGSDERMKRSVRPVGLAAAVMARRAVR